MATAATSLLGLALPVTGELSGTWGDTVNVSITALLDTAVAGTTTLSADADVTLTTTTLAANQARQAVILWTAGGTVTRTITVPAQSKSYIVINKTSSSQSIKIVGVGPTTGVTIVAGTAAFVVWNGVDFVTVSVTSTTGILPVANGGTGLSSGTSGGVLAYTATGTLASSAALAANALVIGGGAGVAPSTTTTGTGVLTFLGTPSSANLAAAVTDETGSGALVFGTSPTFTTSVVGGATMAVFNTTSTTVNAFGAATALNIGAATGTLTVANTTLAAKALTATSITNSALTATRLVYSGTAGLEVDSANLTFNGTDLTVSGAVNAGSVNTTTLDLTNLEVTNIKAKDGTAALQIADTTGVVSVTAAPVMTALTASQAVFTNGSNVLVSNAITGTGNVVMSTSPTLVTPALGAATATSLVSSGTAASSFTVTSGSAVPLTITNVGTGNSFVVEDSASTDSTPVVIDNAGNLTVGAGAQMAGFGSLQALGTGNFLSAIGQFSADTGGAIFSFNKSRSTTIGSPATIVASGDSIGQMRFNGADGTNFIRGAVISAEVDGTPGANDMPGRLVFSTTADGASTPTERMRIDSAGSVGIGQGAGGAGIALDITKQQTGAVSAYTVNVRLNPAVDVTTNSTGYQTFAINGVGTSTTNFFHYTANQGTFAGTAPTNQYGFSANGSLTGATNNYGFYSNIASTANRFNFYAAGTAANYFAGVSQFAAGTAALPGITQISDLNTGIYFPAADTLGFTTGGTERIRIDSAGSVGIGGTPAAGQTLSLTKAVTGAVASNVVFNSATIASDVTTVARGYFSSFATQAAAFTLATLEHFRANQSTIGAASVVTQQFGFNVDSTLTGATTNYGFYSAIAAAANRYNFYAFGTADNYFAGGVGIGAVPTSAAKANITSTSAGASTIALSLQNASNTINSETVLDFVANNQGAGVRSAQILAINTNGGTGVNMVFKISNAAAPAEAMRITSLGGLQIQTGAAVGAATPGTSGVAFPATAIAVADANTLDDYEEGSWTPVVTFTGGNGDLTTAEANGVYTKIGRLVQISFNVEFTETTALTNLTITGLPFTSGSTVRTFVGCWVDNMTALVGSPVACLGVSATTIAIQTTGTGGATSITNLNTATSSRVRGSLSYSI